MIFNEWRLTKLGDEFELVYGKSLPKTKRIEGDYPVYGSGGITGTHNQFLVRGPGIIIGRKGTVGSVYYEQKDYFPIDTTYYVTPSNKYDLKFMYYFLKTQSLDKMNSHSAVPGLNREEVYKKSIMIPDIKEQKAIAEILSSLDDKIELNNAMNETLEEMAQALFKRWFVDFEFPNEEGHPYKSSGGEMVESELGMIPKGWNVVTLDQITSKFNTGLNPRKNFKLGSGNNYYVTIKNMRNRQVYLDDKCDRIDDDAIRIINKRSDLKVGDILFSGIGTIGRVCYICSEPYNWNISESIFTLRANEKITSYFLYLLLISENVQNYAKQLASGSVQKGIRMGDLKKYTLVIPNQEKIYNLSSAVKPLIERIHLNNKETIELCSLRDSLLPKLMSGEIRVSDLKS